MKKKIDNVLLLATDHNVTKAYIHRLNKIGLRPTRIVCLNWRNSSYSNRIDGLTSQQFSKVISEINNTLITRGLFAGDLSLSTEEILNAVEWKFEIKTIDHINDGNLTSFLSNSVDEDYIIFCGGGILRQQILNCGKKFIHIHPGIVPDVKGADCLLWSALVQDQIGMSAFFMNEGIDTGDIIGQRHFSLPHFNIDSKQLGVKTIKSLLVNYVDPHYRAEMLATLFNCEIKPDNWTSKEQCPSEGKTFYFMHKALLPQAISKFCKPEIKMVS